MGDTLCLTLGVVIPLATQHFGVVRTFWWLMKIVGWEDSMVNMSAQAAAILIQLQILPVILIQFHTGPVIAI